jgi:hypothetical protein
MGGTGGGEPVSPPPDGPTPDAPPPATPTPSPPGDCARRFGAGAPSEWVRYDQNGKLVYKTIDEHGDRIMDFSYAGYHGGGVALPEVPVVENVKPSGADDSAAIQAAIDAVSRRPLASGFRGAVLLAPGKYRAGTTITISASGVVLRGSGPTPEGTEIDLSDHSHVFLRIAGGGSLQASGGKPTIVDDYVPAGARTFTVSSADGFKVGDPVVVGRPVTAAWVKFMGMDTINWLGPPFTHLWERTITALEGSKVTVDIPLSDSFDGRYVKPPGGSLQKYTFDGRIAEVGLESFRVTAPRRSPAQANDPTDHGGNQFLEMTNTVDSWIRDLAGHNTVEGIHIEAGCRRITIQDTHIDHEATDYFTESAPFDFNINASEVLIQRSSSKGGNKIMMVTTHHAYGPNVVLNLDADGPRSHIQPHLRWATGLLVDNATAQSDGTGFESAIAFMNRGTAGSGHGWSLGWGVAWNCTAPSILLQKPPGSMVWAIGCKATASAPAGAPGLPPLLPTGIFESMNSPVAPTSLYLAQLCERLGPQALANIGYR